MSLQEWKEKYYPVSAEEAAEEGTLNAIVHSLNKWGGVEWEVLYEHGLEIRHCELFREETRVGRCFNLDSSTCALCKLAYNQWAENTDVSGKCGDCPIFKSTGRNCEAEWYIAYNECNPEPMINLLKQTLSWYLCEYNKGEIYEN